ncbi:MAG TPA: PHP domain-containing protein, partial [Solirubrobacteraceae bacterium]|nr:PHP domain-containing protein [Solirubrobacteraceae bacterium]
LSRRGHRVLILAPSRSPAAVRRSRGELRDARTLPDGLGSLLSGTDGGEPRVIAVGEVLDVPIPTLSARESRRARVGAVPVDVARTLEELLGRTPLDFVHVHDPLPGWGGLKTSSTALRYSRALNVGTFYSPLSRPPATALGRRFSESLLGRLDARIAASEQTADQLEHLYLSLAARRHDPEGDPVLRRRLTKRQLVDVDLHMHTDHSHDCETPVEVLLAAAREAGLGAIAVTDHNEISGALEAREKARGSGVKVIVGEEVKTASQGEVIGLFIEEKIPRGMTLEQTVAEIKRQGGLVYVPHPFDRMHAVPDYQHLLPILDDVDAIEVFNPRVAIGSFNEEAVRFAAKYRIVAGAGSDSHVAQGLGSVRIRMRDFDGAQEFLQSLRDAEITTKPTSLIYVQALKFLQTKATPAAARRATRERRVRRATGDSRK